MRITTRSAISALISVPLVAVMATGCAAAPAADSPATTSAATTTSPSESGPPGIPDPATAKTMLGELTVAPEGSMDGYDRDRFPHWNDTEGGCTVRDEVLKRDGENVEVGSDCDLTGTWRSPYDDGVWTETSDVDIDHVVALAAAWRSGAADWDDAKRSQFANDLESPQLIAVTDDVNQEKGDKDPATWMPPKTDYHCTYASMWIASKHKWKLTVHDAEKAKLEEVLAGC